ncbi:RNA-directed DNA polymerase [Methylomonas sp. SURF-1]|uniref:RNA-directed DNA polymerase n=1 Tax=Methylomonas aurea TaxID=2952224 RepID=A0ABT1UI03_9GAMM|nr:RNA-directed DNA polymerase [Methylomonas sp. SURF-1]MCQ8181868.1 RNA-directed DNA polymerase [Methylomonas sp. SURF-1]
MSILSDDSLEFAKKHITKFYDSDFFPRAFEFDALWHSWDEVKKELSSKNIAKHWVTSPKTLTSMKPKGGFRVVQQLDPLDTIVYTALAYSIADEVENARIPKDQHVACSYRIDLDEGSLFAEGNGFGEFTAQSEKLANEKEYVLATDITDFYNQIYLHRLNNAIEYADSSLKPIGDDIEGFLSRLNGKASQGVPVGPAASIIMSEAVMMDIDEFLINKGVFHTRYVDDFRIFSNSKEQLLSVLEDLTLYLYENHRLTLSGDKTKIIETEKYVSEILHNHYELERVDIFHTLEIFNPYSGEHEEIEVPIENEEELADEQISLLAEKVLERKILDLGLSRALLRKAKSYKTPSLAEIIFENFDFFTPVINDVCLYLSAITNADFVDQWKNELIALTQTASMNRDLVRIWFEWYLSNNLDLLKVTPLKQFIFLGPNIISQSQAAIVSKNLAWVRDKKADLYTVGAWERRSILRATQILPSDEREHWLKLTETTSPIMIDRWVAKWVREAL